MNIQPSEKKQKTLDEEERSKNQSMSREESRVIAPAASLSLLSSSSSSSPNSSRTGGLNKSSEMKSRDSKMEKDIERGCFVAAPSNKFDSKTIIQAAASSSSVTVITPVEFATSLLLSSGLSPDKEMGKLKVFKMNATAEITETEAAAIKAAKNGDLAVLRHLHASGDSLNYHSRLFGETLLHIACHQGHLEIVQFFIQEAKVSIDVVDLQGRNVLHSACQCFNPDLVMLELLVEERPKNLCLPDKMGKTPLEYLSPNQWVTFYDVLFRRSDLLDFDCR